MRLATLKHDWRSFKAFGFESAQQTRGNEDERWSTELGQAAQFRVRAAGNPLPTFSWSFNGDPWAVTGTQELGGMERAGLALVADVQPHQAGIYSAEISGGASSSWYDGILGLITTDKVTGDGSEVAANAVHPNHNIYDQMLLEGAAATMTADRSQVSRTSSHGELRPAQAVQAQLLEEGVDVTAEIAVLAP